MEQIDQINRSEDVTKDKFEGQEKVQTQAIETAKVIDSSDTKVDLSQQLEEQKKETERLKKQLESLENQMKSFVLEKAPLLE